MWDVRRCSLASLEAFFGSAGCDNPAFTTADLPTFEWFMPERLVACRQAVDHVRMEALAARIGQLSGREVCVVWLPRSGYKGVLRNVPQCDATCGELDVDGASGPYVAEVVAVALLPPFAQLRLKIMA